MGKRSSGKFERRERDEYYTPPSAIAPLLPHLDSKASFIDPCAGDGRMMRYLEARGLIPLAGYDIAPRCDGIVRKDMLRLNEDDVFAADMVITNPPWERKLLHALLLHLTWLGIPAWLLIDAGWMFTRQAAPFLMRCEKIVTIGRVKWIPGSDMTGKDDAAWFLFRPTMVPATTFIGRG